MLNEKLISFFKEKEWWYKKEEIEEEEIEVLKSFSIPLDSSFAEFNLQVSDGSSFLSRNIEIFNICWDIINTDGLSELINVLHTKRPAGNLPNNYIPFSSFERDELFFYNYYDDGVYLADEKGMNEIVLGVKKPTWVSFNEFLEWYFEL
ncbi:hypothetical protein G1K75_12250 [Tenacibaculum finnmarkense]|uniref:hypothetical protein n=1 Tax=Tenacibaculum finnmarkense TaxID=2781243 RepID=UPI001EFA4756|nr:hypothetical protein [Tenacibaculum finnmarkense]MCG8806423.1 hypothetical protein [Tenacibaculum finnmarkense]MCG8857535.1 hypothetical protein [Tenacibaculum finnmarkense]